MVKDKIVNKTILINAPVPKVWETLTDPASINQWLSDTEIHVAVDWKVGGHMTFEGVWHGVKYKDKGKVLKFEPGIMLRYNYWSVFSRLPDRPHNYSVIEFKLTPDEDQTLLELTHSKFVIETNYGHSKFYWTLTLGRLKRLIEK